MQTLPGGHGSFSSHPATFGTHAPRQSLHFEQLDVAHPSQIDPTSQLAQKSASHAGAHVPVEKMQTCMAPQSSWVAHGPPPDPVLCDDDDIAPVAPAPVEPAAPVPPEPPWPED